MTDGRGTDVIGPIGSPAAIVDSFDVFETLLVRTVSPPAAVFLEVGRRIQDLGLLATQAATFGSAREWAEKRVNETTSDHGTLDDIYAELAFSIGLTADQQAAMKAVELETERRLLRPVPGAIELVRASRRRCKRAVFVSDMYLPSTFIQEQLQVHGFWETGDVLYVSNTHGCSKRTGKLFQALLKNEQVSPSLLTHFGNDRAADLNGPKLAGCKGVMLPAGNPNRFEKLLGSYRIGTDNLGARLAGASRLARLSTGASTGHEKALSDVAAGVIGPVWTSYLLWVIRRARDLQLRRLYFVSRDAEVLMAMARVLIERAGDDIECRYLYGSRAVWNRAVNAEDANEAWHSMILQSAHGLSNRELLRRTGLSEQDVAPFVTGDVNRWRSVSDRTILKEALSAISRSDLIKTVTVRCQEELQNYFRQEGLFDGVAHGFVDVGWKGTQHEVLAALQSEKQVLPARGLFFGLEESTCRFPETREAFFFDSRAPSAAHLGYDRRKWRRGAPRSRSQFTLMEVFSAGSHGTLIGYEDRGGRIAPILATGRDEEVKHWGLDIVRRALDAFVRNIELDSDKSIRHVDTRQMLITVIDAFRVFPSRKEAEAWGRFPWELGQGSDLHTMELAPKRTVRGTLCEIGKRITTRDYRRSFSEWADGSRARSSLLANIVTAPGEMASVLRHQTLRIASKLRRR